MISHFKICLLCLLILPCQGVWSQYHNLRDTTGKDHYHCIGYQVAYAANQDLKLSTQVFNGFGGGLHGGFISYSNHKYREFQFNGGYEYLTSPHETRADQAWAQMQYRYLFWLRNDSRRQLYLGPYIETFGQMRITDALSNNSFNWDVMGGVGPSIHAELSLKEIFKLKKWRLFSDFSLPLVAYVHRPNYVLPSRETEHHLSWIGQTVRVQWMTGVKIPAGRQNANQYQVWYRWGFLYHKDNEVQHLSSGRHSVGFSFLFNTKSSKNHEQP